MKLIFDEEEVKAILLAKAASMGIEANTVKFKASYGDLESAELSYDPKVGNDEESST